MTDEPVVEAQYDASRVMFNGAAIALVTNLTNGIRDSLTAEIKASEQRSIADRREFEQRTNDRLDDAIHALTGDVDDLEQWRRTVEDARLIRKGQVSVFSAAGGFLMRYDKLILAATIAVVGALLALFGFAVRVGP